MKTQNQTVLSHMKRYGKITTLTAFQRYGITRLSGRIYDLRKVGYEITQKIIAVKNRFGNTCHVAEYKF